MLGFIVLGTAGFFTSYLIYVEIYAVCTSLLDMSSTSVGIRHWEPGQPEPFQASLYKIYSLA